MASTQHKIFSIPTSEESRTSTTIIVNQPEFQKFLGTSPHYAILETDRGTF